MTSNRKVRPTQQPSDRYAGRSAGVFGLKGELKCDPTSAGRTVFLPGAVLRCERSGASSDVTIQSVREHQHRLLLKLQGVDDATAAQAYAGARFFAPRERFILEPGEYLDEDLIGCVLVDEGGTNLGAVTAVEHYPGQDLLVVRSARVPMVAQFIRSIDLNARTISVELPTGLVDPAQAEEA